MAQVTIYLDKDTEEKMRKYTKLKDISQSQWIANLIREKLLDVWPDEVVALAGAWEDFPSQEALRAEIEPDLERETL